MLIFYTLNNNKNNFQILRVIHFANWNAITVNEQFERWFSFAICEVIIPLTTKSPLGQFKIAGDLTMAKSNIIDMKTTKIPKWRKATTVQLPKEPSNVILTPVSVTSLIVSWTCCTNKIFDYIIMYSPDAKLSKENWKQISATCSDSYGVVLKNLPTNTEYTTCVVSAYTLANKNSIYDDKNCDSVYLSAKNIAPYGAVMLSEAEKRQKLIQKQDLKLKSNTEDFCSLAGYIIDSYGNCVGTLFFCK